MSKIASAFQNGKAFIAFLTAGDPSPAKSVEYILAMADAGADLIEIGIPFSDPVAEGAVIQEANLRALAVGTTTDTVFDIVREARESTVVPLVFLTYLNPVFLYGYERFFTRCKELGVDGIIIPDLPFEEKHEVSDVAARFDVDVISLIAPTSAERIRTIAAEATGFVYVVSSMGVTGVRDAITTDLNAMVGLVREATTVPCAVGFGIATPEQAAAAAAVADGAIVGSAIVKIIARDGENAAPALADYVRAMKAAVRSAE